jgi:diacylglycerol kinase (ATP)
MLVNPTSGKGRASSGAPAAEARLRERGFDVVHIQGVDAEHAMSSLREAIEAEPTAAVVACGGDGTVHLVLQVLAGTDVPMGILPLGTGNDSATVLGIPTDPEAAADLVADCLQAGTSKRLDAGRAVTADGVSRWFLAVLSSGFDSMVNERANLMTWPTGQARYLRAILAELRSFKPVPYLMVVDEGLPTEHRHEGAGMLVAVGNGTSYGGGMKVCPGALLDDGLLSITFLGELPTATFLRVFPTVYKGTHVSRPEVQEHTGLTVRLEAAGQVAYADGERIGPLPVEVGVTPGAIRILAR